MVLRSKASWGYSSEFMAACVDVLRVSPESIREGEMRVAVAAGPDLPLGISKVVLEDGVAVLDLLYVAPEAMGRGVGALLFRDAVARARELGGGTVMTIDADPNAEPFYRRHGAVRVGEVPSEVIPGRMLPRLEVNLIRP